MNNQIIALPKKTLFANKSFEGFKPFCYERYWDIIKKEQMKLEHKKIENNDEFIQPIIILCVYQPGENSLFYFKNQNNAKNQEWSIAVTGHIKEIPEISYSLHESGISLFREKFKNRQHFSLKPLGYLYSSESTQTKNHFGLLFLVNVDDALRVCCPELFASSTVDKKEIDTFINSSFPFDPWTKLVYEAVSKHIKHY